MSNSFGDIFCFDNVPEAFFKNDPQVYNSSNFVNKILPSSKLNLYCSKYYPIDMTVYLITIAVPIIASVVSAGFLTQVTTIFFKNRNKLVKLFTEIIEEAKKDTEKKGEEVLSWQ